MEGAELGMFLGVGLIPEVALAEEGVEEVEGGGASSLKCES